MIETLSEEQKDQLRKIIVLEAEKCLDVQYELGSEWVDYSRTPEKLDCSELVEGCYNIAKLTMKDGSQNQYDFTVPIVNPKFGDLAFMGKDMGNSKKIYHVGIVFDDKYIIEARAFDGRPWTGKVCLREKVYWENWRNFAGYRSHPKLA